jgi:rare lipoprotein A (peptidoglycan hydrolase)
MTAALAIIAASVSVGMRDVGRAVARHRPDPPPFESAVASYYDYGGASTGACGALRADGVANRTMPCGLRLTMCAARCAPATVDDRGPYVAGRDFDLSLSLAQAIGFDFGAGVATIRWRQR